MLASKEVLRGLPQCRGNGSQANDQRAEFSCGIRCFSTTRDDLAELIELAEDAVSVGLWLRQFRFSRRQAVLCILSICWIRELL
jgi:hypothetical protein